MAQANIQGCGDTPHLTGRIVALDVARGIALLFVCFNHFLDTYSLDPHAQTNTLLLGLLEFTKMATPMFIFVSSMVLGYLCSVPHKDGPQFRFRLFDRALFVATVGHCIIAATNMYLPQQDFLTALPRQYATALSRGYVTDTIAFCMIGSLLVLPYAKAATRVQVGIGLYLISWAGWTLWYPDNGVLLLLKGIFFGPNETGAVSSWFPLLPWFAVYLGGTSIGEWLSRFDGETLALAGEKLARRSGIVLCVAVLMYGALRLFVAVHPTAGVVEMYSRIRDLVSPFNKYPPSPWYLLVFGSAALLLIGYTIWKMGETHNERYLGHLRYLRILQQVGKNSLLLFMLQFVIYFQIFSLLVTRTQLVTPGRAILFLLLSLLGMAALGGLCDRLQLNRSWTVGLPALMKRWPILTTALLTTAAKPDDLFRVAAPEWATPALSPVGQQQLEEENCVRGHGALNGKIDGGGESRMA